MLFGGGPAHFRKLRSYLHQCTLRWPNPSIRDATRCVPVSVVLPGYASRSVHPAAGDFRRSIVKRSYHEPLERSTSPRTAFVEQCLRVARDHSTYHRHRPFDSDRCGDAHWRVPVHSRAQVKGLLLLNDTWLDLPKGVTGAPSSLWRTRAAAK